MFHSGTVSSEGGPLLLADAIAVHSWHGASEDSSDYERVCLLWDDLNIPGFTIEIGEHQGIIWELGGAGTADVFCTEDGTIHLVRAWLRESRDMASIHALAELPIHTVDPFASLRIGCGRLAILWAPESGECILPEDVNGTGNKPPSGDLSINGAGLVVSLPNGDYTCLHDRVELNGQKALRCHIVRTP